jgi:uncharacterized LabA/DUF88 family protein
MADPNQERLAVIIDADNANPGTIEELLQEVAKYGTASVKRAYGDWTTSNLRSWKEVLHKHAIQPIQQFSYTRGKNATDSAMIIDAMDLLFKGNFSGFCIVSSDSDFTRLATRIREEGLTVYGFGEEKTPEPFIAACDRFIFVEVLGKDQKPVPEQAGKRESLRKVVTTAIEAVAKDDGWAALSSVGQYISKNHPSFDSRNYGFPRLGELMESQKYVETRYSQAGEHRQISVKLKGR